MWHCLTGRRPVVDADVEAIRRVLKEDALPCLIEQRQQRLPLDIRHIEERADVPLRYHQTVARRDRTGVDHKYRVVVLFDNAFARELTEGACSRRSHPASLVAR